MWATPKTSSPSRTWGPSWTWTSSVFSFFPFLGAILVENYLDKTFRLRKIFKKGSGPVDGNKTLNEMSGKKPYIFWKCHLFIITFSFWLYNAFLRNDISKKSRNLHIMPVILWKTHCTLNSVLNRVNEKVPKGNLRTWLRLASIYCPIDKFYTDSIIDPLYRSVFDKYFGRLSVTLIWICKGSCFQSAHLR